MENKITCPDCRGLGWNIGSPANTSTSAKCDTCGGTGYVPYTQPEKHYKPMFSVEYGDAKKLAEENAYLKRQLAEAREIVDRILHDFATMLMALVPKEILDKAIDEALITPPQEATDE